MRQRGFTLIEMSVVVAIIGILYMTVVPMYGKTIIRAKETALQKDLYIFRKTLDSYYKDNEKWPSSLQTLVTEGYLRAIPNDPFTENNTSWSVIPSADGVDDVFDVKSGAEGTSLSGKSYKDF